MKRILFITMLLSLSNHLIAQTWDEWFRQKKAKLKYIAQQIAALEVYAGYLKKGYEIVDDGWNAVDDIKHGDFDMHSNYFNSLKQISSFIAHYDKIDAIANLQVQILQVDAAIKKFVQNNENIQVDEKEYIGNVMANLLDKCIDDLNQLKMVTTKDSVLMKDDERLKRIDDIYLDMQDKYGFVKYFQSNVQTLALSREKEINNVNTFKLLYGIK